VPGRRLSPGGYIEDIQKDRNPSGTAIYTIPQRICNPSENSPCFKVVSLFLCLFGPIFAELRIVYPSRQNEVNREEYHILLLEVVSIE
jgi:hypothetical protein